MIYTENLLEDIIIKPYREGLQELSVVTGQTSPAFIHHLLYSLEKLELKIIIGLANEKTIPIWDHNEYVKLTQNTGRLSINYYLGSPPIHSNIYIWSNQLKTEELVFIGSAEFTRNSFSKYKEVMTRVNHLETKNELLGLQKIISCIDPNVYNQVKFLSNRGNSNNINTLDLIKYTNGRPYVDLKLTEANDENKVPLKSGLNWGQRSGRNQNQAYINVPTHIRNTYPDFFPNQKEKFVLVTDDGYHFICVMSQDNAKAITTSRDTSELGKYFRKRLGVELGNLITINDLDSYGRDYVRIYKLNDETYFLEFS